MADDDTPQTPTEAQDEAPQQPAPVVPQEGKDAQAAPAADDYAPKQGESLEAYAQRIRTEVNWRDRQLSRQHRKIKESDERATKLQEIEAENARLRQLAESGKKPAADSPSQPAADRPAGPAAGPPTDLKAQARFEVQVERLGADLLEKHADEWKSAHANFERAGGVQPEFLAAVLETDNPSYVMLKLGKDMSEYQRILDLPEGRRRAALFKLGMEPGQKPAEAPVRKPSAAPQPTTGALPPGSAAPAEGDVNLYDPKLSSPEYDAAWYARRVAEKRNSKGRPWSVGGRGS